MFGKSQKWFKDNLVEILPKVRGTYKQNVPMSKYTWLGVGGPAEVMFSPYDEDDLALFLKTKSYNLPICVIGGGSNLLVRDGGIPGVVIKLDSKYFRQIKVNEDNSVRLREQPLAWANVGLPDPELIYISLNESYNGVYNSYDPATGVITMALEYTCSAGSLGTALDQVLIPQ